MGAVDCVIHLFGCARELLRAGSASRRAVMVTRHWRRAFSHARRGVNHGLPAENDDFRVLPHAIIEHPHSAGRAHECFGARCG